MAKKVKTVDNAKGSVIVSTNNDLVGILVNFLLQIGFTSYDNDLNDLNENGAFRIKSVEEMTISSVKKYMISCYKDKARYEKETYSNATFVQIVTSEELEKFLAEYAELFIVALRYHTVSTLTIVQFRKKVKEFFRVYKNEQTKAAKKTAPKKSKSDKQAKEVVKSEEIVDGVPTFTSVESKHVKVDNEEAQKAGIKAEATDTAKEATLPMFIITLENIDKEGRITAAAEEISPVAYGEYTTVINGVEVRIQFTQGFSVKALAYTTLMV